uniref:Uncharacterized protein n=1 Tax=Globodera rostochiensis TaxID=31243 RepID=A0A914I9M3_GLORO
MSRNVNRSPVDLFISSNGTRRSEDQKRWRQLVNNRIKPLDIMGVNLMAPVLSHVSNMVNQKRWRQLVSNSMQQLDIMGVNLTAPVLNNVVDQGRWQDVLEIHLPAIRMRHQTTRKMQKFEDAIEKEQ